MPAHHCLGDAQAIITKPFRGRSDLRSAGLSPGLANIAIPKLCCHSSRPFAMPPRFTALSLYSMPLPPRSLLSGLCRYYAPIALPTPGKLRNAQARSA